MSPAFICFILVVGFFESFVYESWRGLEAIMSHILINLGSKYAIYTVMYPDASPVRVGVYTIQSPLDSLLSICTHINYVAFS